MFLRNKWLIKHGRLHDPWVAAFYKGEYEQSEIMHSETVNIEHICNDLIEVIRSNSNTITHRISLRLAAQLTAGVSIEFKKMVDTMVSDLDLLPDVEEYQNMMNSSYENDSSELGIRRLYSPDYIDDDDDKYSDSSHDNITEGNKTFDDDEIEHPTRIHEMTWQDQTAPCLQSQQEQNCSVTYSRSNSSLHNEHIELDPFVNKPIDSSSNISNRSRVVNNIPYSNRINENFDNFMAGLPPECPSIKKTRHKKLPPVKDKFVSLAPLKSTPKPSGRKKCSLRCDNPREDIVDTKYKSVAILFKEMATKENVSSRLLKLFQRNTITFPKMVDKDIFKPSPLLERHILKRNSEERRTSISSKRSECTLNSVEDIRNEPIQSNEESLNERQFHDLCERGNQNITTRKVYRKLKMNVSTENSSYRLSKINIFGSDENNMPSDTNEHNDSLSPPKYLSLSSPSANFSNDEGSIDHHIFVITLYPKCRENNLNIKDIKFIMAPSSEDFFFEKINDLNIEISVSNSNLSSCRMNNKYNLSEVWDDYAVFEILAILWLRKEETTMNNILQFANMYSNRKIYAVRVFKSLIDLKSKRYISIQKNSENLIENITLGPALEQYLNYKC